MKRKNVKIEALLLLHYCTIAYSLTTNQRWKNVNIFDALTRGVAHTRHPNTTPLQARQFFTTTPLCGSCTGNFRISLETLSSFICAFGGFKIKIEDFNFHRVVLCQMNLNWLTVRWMTDTVCRLMISPRSMIVMLMGRRSGRPYLIARIYSPVA